ncbi:hypothetical protein DL771_002997 [Monosporascus sp. 5C6A]|nr:hypothetical protein DL771_002997 [Monosporascus sp. 5C6A]
MEPLSIVGATASVAQLLDIARKTSASAWNVSHSIINAPEELAQLAKKLDRLKMIIEQVEKLEEKGSTMDLHNFFPAAHRQIVFNCLRSNADTLQALKSFQRPSNSKRIDKRLRWATIDKRKAQATMNEVKDAEHTLDVALSILTVQASIYDLDDKNRHGLLEHVLRAVMEYLLDEGCTPNVYHGVDELPATLQAFDLGLSGLFNLLLFHGADVESFGINPSRLVSSRDSYDVYKWKLRTLRSLGFSDWGVKNDGFGESLLHAACSFGDWPEILFALEIAGIDPSISGAGGASPLHETVASGELAVASALLTSGANVNTSEMTWSGPPLRLSATWQRFNMAHFLLFHGANPNLTDAHLQTTWTRNPQEETEMSLQDEEDEENGEDDGDEENGEDDGDEEYDDDTEDDEDHEDGDEGEDKGDDENDYDDDDNENGQDNEDNGFPGSLGHPRALFFHTISTAEGRREMSTFPLVRTLCNALQNAGYRAEMDSEGDIWYDEDDGDVYYDAREEQLAIENDDGPIIDCAICRSPERYGLGHIVQEAAFGRQKLLDYREELERRKKRIYVL